MVSRRRFIQSGLLALGATTVPALQPVLAEPSKHGIVGFKAPELRVEYWIDKDGKASSFNLSDHKDKWVFLKCFQHWCPACHSHGLPAVKKMSDALADNPNVVFAGIQTVFEGRFINTQSRVRETQLKYDLQIPMGHDPGIEHSFTMQDFRTGGTPWMIIINPKGFVVFNDFSINVDKAIAYFKAETANS